MTERLAAPAIRRAVEVLAHTWRLEIAGEEHVATLREQGTSVLFAVWHALLLPPLWHRKREHITLLVSQHGDAEGLAEAGRHWGYELARGSSTRGGIGALKRVISVLRAGGDAAVTPDGPRGPQHIVKDGAVLAAVASGAAIVPVGVAAARSWRLNSWDRFMIPGLGARVHVRYGPPLFPTSHRRDSGTLGERLDRATAEARCRL